MFAGPVIQQKLLSVRLFVGQIFLVRLLQLEQNYTSKAKFTLTLQWQFAAMPFQCQCEIHVMSLCAIMSVNNIEFST